MFQRGFIKAHVLNTLFRTALGKNATSSSDRRSSAAHRCSVIWRRMANALRSMISNEKSAYRK